MRMIVAVLLFVTAPAYAQPAPQRDPEREHGLLVGACLAALSETTRLTDIEVYGLLPRAVSECRLSPGPTRVIFQNHSASRSGVFQKLSPT
jgi:hypothetical protein